MCFRFPAFRFDFYFSLFTFCFLAIACMNQRTDQTRTTVPYGTWASPLNAARVTAGALRFGDLVLDGDAVYWTEGRAAEGGRT